MLALGIALTFFSSCSRHSDPQSAYDHAWKTFQRGDLAGAEQEAKQDYADFHSSSPEWAWKYTIFRGRILYERGRYEDVLSLLSAEPAAVPSPELAIRRRWLEGFSYTSLHKFPEAEAKLADAERLCTAPEYAPACADVSSARGRLEMERGHFAEAQVFFERVLAFARANHDRLWEADALLDLSWAADEQTHFDEALDWAAAARQIAGEKGVADISQKALGNMGWADYKLGDIEKAESIFTEAKNQAKALGEPSSEAGWLLDLGHLYMDKNDFDAAQQAFQDALALARKVNSREDIGTALAALAFVSEQQPNKLDDASRYADEALAMAQADGIKRDEIYPRLVLGRVAAKRHDAASAEAAFREVEQSLDAPVFLKWEAERSLAHLYEDGNQIEAAGREYRTALSTFEGARAELKRENSRLPFLSNATRIYDDYIQFLVKQNKSDEALQVAEYSRARTLNEGLGLLKANTAKTGSLKAASTANAPTFHPDPLSARQIAGRSGGIILFYWLGEKHSYLWTITPQKTVLSPLPAASEIEGAVQRYRKSLLGPLDPLATSNSDGLGLYRTLVAPAATLLAKDAKVFIVPDGSLNTINFETLMVPGPTPHYWIEDVTLADAGSLRLLAASHASGKHSGPLLLIGNSVSPNSDYPQLSKAADEMENVARHFPPAQQKTFAREQATPAAYLSSQPEQFSYIHFVAHGTASRMSPLDSAIVLSKAGLSKTGIDDDSFKLYARDIIHHPLHADLVTISTCYGAGTRAYSGEGLVGLSWAFLLAGAHNVVGALWEVSDVSTPGLMDALYEDMNRGKNPEAALRAAKLSLLRSGGTFARPFYWAPFQIYTGS